MAATSFSDQLNLLDQLQTKLKDTQQYLDHAVKEYEVLFNNLANAGLMREWAHEYFHEFLVPTKDKVNELIEHLQVNDAQRVRQYVDKLKDDLATG